MKTKTLSILFALVMILSMAVGAFAQDYEYDWDDETVLSIFSDMDIAFPDLLEDSDSDFMFMDTDAESVPDFESKDASDYVSKAPIDSGAKAPTMKASFSPCGDGLIKFDVTIHRKADASGTKSGYYGPYRKTYIRNITATVDGKPAEIKKCDSTGGDECRSVNFNNKGEAHIRGYIYAPSVLKTGVNPSIELSIVHSTYRTIWWTAEKEDPIKVSAVAKADPKSDYCQKSLEEFGLGGKPAVQGKYDENTGEARFLATIRNYKPTDKVNYVIPADIQIDGIRYTDYTCKYRTYDFMTGAPVTNTCTYGDGIMIAPNSVITFDITLDHIASKTLLKAAGGDIAFKFRVGGMMKLMKGTFEAVFNPCPPKTIMTVKDPLRPFLSFYEMEGDPDIKPYGPYGVYEGGLWGFYQKCGCYAFMMVRLQNDGVKDEIINLNNVAVSIAGGTPAPSDVKWVFSTVAPLDSKHVLLEPGEDVILGCRVKVTPYPYQTNSDLAINGAINFLDYGYYISGKVVSDHNNFRCDF